MDLNRGSTPETGGLREEETERRVVAALEALFSRMAAEPEVEAAYPGFARLHAALAACRARGDAEEAGDALARLYCHVHGGDESYDPSERRELDERGGYWCHAGGISPLVRAAAFIGPGTRLVDYGAGNGFQGLLFQFLHPHRLTTLVELSGPMIARGRRLQRLMGVPRDRVSWVHGDVAHVSPAGFDFVYLYRPMRPEGAAGRAFYGMLARELTAAGRPVVVFSIADCLKGFLGPGFRVLHDDGHLTILSNAGGGE